MNEKIKELLTNELEEVIKSIKDFSKEHIPDTAKQILEAYKIDKYFEALTESLGLLLGLVIAVFTILGPPFSDDAAFIIPNFVNLVGSFQELYKIKHTPKAMLLSLIRRM